MSGNIKVLVVEPKQPCRVQEIPDTLEAMQQIVGGRIESFSLQREAIVSNEEGKLLGLPLNRPLYDKNGTAIDTLRGTFFITGVDGEHFVSLTDEQIQQYKLLYDDAISVAAEKAAPQADIMLDFAVACEVLVSLPCEIHGDDAAKDGVVQRVTEIFSGDKELSDRTVGCLNFEFGDACVKIQYTFAKRDSGKTKAERFSEQCVRNVQKKLEESGCKVTGIVCYAEELDETIRSQEQMTHRNTKNKRKGSHHER